jgi:acyl-CoA thioester hydrolase
MSTPFQHRLVVQSADIDDMGHVNNVVYVRYVQEVAAAHWEVVASAELKNKYAWVVLRHEIDYRAQAFLKDELIGTTWVGEANGARFDRFVKMVRVADQKVIAEARTTWCMLDAATLRPSRIGPDVLAVL